MEVVEVQILQEVMAKAKKEVLEQEDLLVWRVGQLTMVY